MRPSRGIFQTSNNAMVVGMMAAEFFWMGHRRGTQANSTDIVPEYYNGEFCTRRAYLPCHLGLVRYALYIDWALAGTPKGVVSR